MQKLEHVGIAVKNLDKANKLYARLLGVKHYKIEEVASEGVKTSFFKIGDIKIELLEATTAESPIAKFIDTRGEGIHHLAFEVVNIGEAIRECSENEFALVSAVPKHGADNKLICFLHPKSTGGVLVELCQEINRKAES